MEPALSIIGIGIVVFVSTDIDDLVVISAFFAERRLRPLSIVLGQYLGMATLVAISALAALLALSIPAGVTALLGLIPLGLGLFRLWRLWSGRGEEEDDLGREADEAEHRVEARSHSQLLAVAAVTVANGGDNLGVYIPMFATAPTAVPLYATVFAVMTGLWCLLGYLFVANPVGRAVVGRWGELILPFVLIAVGLHILWGAWDWLPQLPADQTTASGGTAP